ncbi:MAG TPA: GH92 family glycosyl hydrolase [Lentimicrobium sp.]|nr:GH92 family glycosyl hydrolase [Lentimicrobium sp.]
MSSVKPLLLLTALFVMLNSVISQSVDKPDNPSKYVNPFIGTGGHGHTFPGATVPFGMVQLSPDTRLEGWDGCGGYHYSDEYIYGFSHTHLSGTGVPDYCDVLVMPFTGEINWNNGADGNPGYRSRFNHLNETATAGYYRVYLENPGVEAQLTATERAGFHSYEYKKGGKRQILIDLKHRDKVTNSWIKVISDTEIAGFRGSSYWADDQRVYFYMIFSEKTQDYNFAVDDKQIVDPVEYLTRNDGTAESKNLKAAFSFGTGAKPILVKVGISGTSVENAKANLMAEIEHWDFNKVKESAKNKWDKELSKIEITKGDSRDMTVFYTALYHTMVCPNIYNDVNGSYLGRDLKEHKTDHNYYTVFSLWDTYRAYHPLMTIIDQKRTNDFIRTFIKQFEDGGLLPVWELSSNETWCMIGYHSIPVIADAYIKGIRDYDVEKALTAMLTSANKDIFGLEFYKKSGFIPADKEHESVSKTLEYCYDDWCIAQMAKTMGKSTVADTFMHRAQGYRNLFDPETGFMRARYNGAWFKPFDPREVNNNYTEANSWQYSFYVPHDMDHFIKLLGGKQALESKLDGLFTAPQETTGREQSDITGLIGQYAHGNEPSHQIAYLYNYAGVPWKTQEKVDYILHNFYTDQPDGLIGNEDCGQMSAWAVLSSLGFYPVCPGTDQYVIGNPMFEEAVINLENGNKFKITATNRSSSNKYIQSAELNGQRYDKSYITHGDIMKGGELRFVMGSSPSESWGSGLNNEPKGIPTTKNILPAPVISNDSQLFDNTLEIKVIPYNEAIIRYTLDGSEPVATSTLYSSPVLINKSTVFQCKAFKEGFEPSATVQSIFTRRPEGVKLILHSKYEPQYSGNGENTLLDGLRGNEDFRLGGWQGYQGVNIEAEIRLDNTKPVDLVSIGFLQDVNAWIFMPDKVQLWSSSDGINYNLIETIYNSVPNDKWGVIKHDFEFKVNGLTDRFLKLRATNIGTCPAEHKGYPNAAWIFSDEINIVYK